MSAPAWRYYELDIPLRYRKPPLTANMRLHWFDRAERTKKIHQATKKAARQAGIPVVLAARRAAALHARRQPPARRTSIPARGHVACG